MQAARNIRRWTREEYHRMAEIGLFRNQRVELIEGEIISMAAMNSSHRTVINLADDLLRSIFGAGYFVSVQCPLALGPASEPEPDIAVIAGNIRDYTNAHPTTAALIVEVAESSLAHDRRYKGSLYARAGILDYWIINLKRRRLEVRRRPQTDAAESFGYGYAEITLYGPNDTVSPLARPDALLQVRDLLP